ncbi:hypothetical protein [Parvicella tangerina]|uniref:DUF4367 domain-containing protein n=1 Tax=Parvicella tangerina TaxID=2829795 RepID=A0A916JKP9_9FLAO|nr:hypothetical protein [Parvicella tangerina]CAG5079113.1 hypothetical protein CRYO30217_00860 [Parvicella tangerina]
MKTRNTAYPFKASTMLTVLVAIMMSSSFFAQSNSRPSSSNEVKVSGDKEKPNTHTYKYTHDIKPNNPLFAKKGNEKLWTGFSCTLYLDSTNYFKKDDKKVHIHLGLNSSELSPQEIYERAELLNAYQVENHNIVGSMVYIDFSTTLELFKENKVYLLNVFRVDQAFVNEQEISLDKIKQKLK